MENLMSTSLYREKKVEPKETVFEKIEKWGDERNFYGEGGADLKGQLCKLIEEVGELAGNIARGKDITDDLGDAVVVITHIARLAGTDIISCVNHSYNEIKDRKGEWKNGMFVKESDLK